MQTQMDKGFVLLFLLILNELDSHGPDTFLSNNDTILTKHLTKKKVRTSLLGANNSTFDTFIIFLFQ